MKRRTPHLFLCMILAAVLAFAPFTVSWAAVGRSDHTVVDFSADIGNWPAAPEIASEAACLLDASSGEILFHRNSNQRMYPASITKLLTAYVVVQDSDLDEELMVTQEAMDNVESDAFSGEVSTGDVLTVRDALYVMLLNSNNEMSSALAVHNAGSISAFADKMNAAAQQFGAANSHFANPHGLYNEEHYITAEDYAKIVWGVLQDDRVLEMASTLYYRTAPTHTCPDGINCVMLHGMFNPDYAEYYPYAVAGKTGHIAAAGFTLATYAKKGNQELICITLNAESRGESYNDTQNLFEYGFNEFVVVDTASYLQNEEIQSRISAQVQGLPILEIIPGETSLLTVPKESANRIRQEVSLTPGEDGEIRSGTLSCRIDDRILSTISFQVKVQLPEPETTPETEESQPGSGWSTGEGETWGTPGETTAWNRIRTFFMNTDVWLAVIAIGAVLIVVVLVLIISTYAKEKRRLKEKNRRKNMYDDRRTQAPSRDAGRPYVQVPPRDAGRYSGKRKPGRPTEEELRREFGDDDPSDFI